MVDLVHLLVAPSRILLLTLSFGSLVDLFVELKLVTDKWVDTQVFRQILGVFNVHLEVQVVQADEFRTLVNHELLWQLILNGHTILCAGSVTDGDSTVRSTGAVNWQNNGVQEVFKLEAQRLQLDETLSDENRIWRVPERIGLLFKDRELPWVKVVVQDVSDDKETVDELVFRPFVIVLILGVVYLNNNFGFALAALTIFQEGI